LELLVNGFRRQTPLALQIACCVGLTACADNASPSTPDEPLKLAVAVRLDSAEFKSRGEFILDLVPSDLSGHSYVTDTWTIDIELSAPDSVTVDQVSQGLEPADSAPVAAAILIDDSGSMLTADPERKRAAAAQLFWREILPRRSGNAVALLDFGRGNSEPTAGFLRTNLLVGLTEDESLLDAGLGQIQAVPGGGTPLYTSGREVISWLNSVALAGSVKTLVVITDGSPGDDLAADSLFATTAALGTRIFSVGVGNAARQDPPSTAAILAEELATRTGGIYAAADPPLELETVLQVLAQSASPARLIVRMRLETTVPRGTEVRGTATVEGARGRAQAEWSFVAP
jgi:hypothetical protein